MRMKGEEELYSPPQYFSQVGASALLIYYYYQKKKKPEHLQNIRITIKPLRSQCQGSLIHPLPRY